MSLIERARAVMLALVAENRMLLASAVRLAPGQRLWIEARTRDLERLLEAA